MINKLTVTIGIPAHNEANTIGKTLEAIFQQKADNFDLKRIIVVCDGCTDNTAEIVEKAAKKFPIIELFNDGYRTGKATRVNMIYNIATTDVIVTLDADIQFENSEVLENMVLPFQNKDVGIVGAKDTPAQPHNLMEKVAVTWVKPWDRCRFTLNNGDNPHNLHGNALAISNELAKKIELPKEVLSDDIYLHLIAKRMGYKFFFAENANVHYSVPNTLKDYFKQSSRFLDGVPNLEHLLGNQIYNECKIPWQHRYKILLKEFVKSPFYITLGILIQIYIRTVVMKKATSKITNGIWDVTVSTKRN